MATKFLIIACIIFSAGCMDMRTGQLYNNITEPYSTDFNNTSIGSKQFVLDEHHIQDPIGSYDITVEWSTDLINEEARKAGISHISYVDMQTLSFFFETYKRKRLIVHGD